MDQPGTTVDMNLSDAFQKVTIEQVEIALAADADHGFPEDVFGLARFLMRIISVLSPESMNPAGLSADAAVIDDAIEQRVATMVEHEQLKLSHYE